MNQLGSQHFHHSNWVSCQGGEVVAGESFGTGVRQRGGGSLQVHALFDALERWHRGWQMDLRLLSDLKVWWLQVEGHMVV